MGQGDIPSPILWAAAFDTLLCALNFLNSNFSIRDLNYNSHESVDVCYADDLVSAVASLMELQAKADVVSAWCIIMGVKISHAKFRTFGMDWGTKKKVEGKLIIHTEGWTEVLVDVKSDGVLTHLGMVWNTDMKNKELWNGIAAKIEDLGWRIARTWVRAGDKLMAMKYKKLDEIYIRVLRKITKNMPGYPALPVMSGKRDGGLGIETPLMHAHKCKLRILMRGMSKGGLTSKHLENLLRIELEKTGMGGLPGQGVSICVNYGTAGYITSLVEWLDEIRLALHLPGLIYNSPNSMWIGVPNNGKRSRKLDGVQYRMKCEENVPANTGRETLVRTGQFWEVHGGLLEIMSVDGELIEARKWSGMGNRLRTDTEVTLVESETRTIPLETIQSVQKLARVVETSKKVRKITKKITNLMERKPVLCKPVPPSYTGNNLAFEGFEFDTIYNIH